MKPATASRTSSMGQKLLITTRAMFPGKRSIVPKPEFIARTSTFDAQRRSRAVHDPQVPALTDALQILHEPEREEGAIGEFVVIAAGGVLSKRRNHATAEVRKDVAGVDDARNLVDQRAAPSAAEGLLRRAVFLGRRDGRDVEGSHAMGCCSLDAHSARANCREPRSLTMADQRVADASSTFLVSKPPDSARSASSCSMFGMSGAAR
jgi:hypothetical protein